MSKNENYAAEIIRRFGGQSALGDLTAAGVVALRPGEFSPANSSILEKEPQLQLKRSVPKLMSPGEF